VKDRRSRGSSSEFADLLISGGTVLTVDAEDTVLSDGAVAVRGGRIAAVGPRKALERRFRARRRLDAAGRLVLPGLVNAHTHAAMTLFRGVRDDCDLMTWLNQYLFPLEARFVSPRFVRSGARLACWEMIASGTTTFADGYFFTEEVARAADEAGLRAFPGQAIFDAPTPDAKTPADGLERTERLLADWRGHPRITPAVFPHAAYTAGPETFRASFELAERFDAPVLTHLSESAGELSMVRERYGTTPVRHLARHGLLDSRLTAAHAVCVDADEIDLLGRAGVGVVHCPESNLKLASGIAPVGRLLASGIPVGLGTDGPASNNDLDLFGEIATVAKIHKLHALDPTAIPARLAVRLATAGGAAALHREKEFGSLEEGKRADVIVVEASGPNALPLYDPYSYLVYSARSDAVETVVVEGKILMEKRRMRTLDTEAIRRDIERSGRKIEAAVWEGDSPA